MEYEIVIEKEEDPKAGYSVYCPALPGCFSNGRTPAEARRNMREAMELFVQTLRSHDVPIPRPRKTVRIDQLKLAVPA
ncbi:MAG: type II toxin-antitoxin system HicB family antitoxin [Verrucomicrobia bacterium]|nr:type II toxin-antitoxin system HicB family antitoxin [Verrucomicrobiota bacterium]